MTITQRGRSRAHMTNFCSDDSEDLEKFRHARPRPKLSAVNKAPDGGALLTAPAVTVHASAQTTERLATIVDVFKCFNVDTVGVGPSVCTARWSIGREAASCGPSASADTLNCRDIRSDRQTMKHTYSSVITILRTLGREVRKRQTKTVENSRLYPAAATSC